MGLVSDIFCKLLPRFIVTCKWVWVSVWVCVCVCVYVCSHAMFWWRNLRPAGILSISGLWAILLASQAQWNGVNSIGESWRTAEGSAERTEWPVKVFFRHYVTERNYRWKRNSGKLGTDDITNGGGTKSEMCNTAIVIRKFYCNNTNN